MTDPPDPAHASLLAALEAELVERTGVPDPLPCPRCRGARVVITQVAPPGYRDRTKPCPECRGTGLA